MQQKLAETLIFEMSALEHLEGTQSSLSHSIEHTVRKDTVLASCPH